MIRVSKRRRTATVVICKDSPCLNEPLHWLYIKALFVMYFYFGFLLGLYPLTEQVVRYIRAGVVTCQRLPSPKSIRTRVPPHNWELSGNLINISSYIVLSILVALLTLAQIP